MSTQQTQKKSAPARLSRIYEYDLAKGTIRLRNRKCPRCGNIMAFHKAPVKRYTCGSCSFTDYVK
jgi:small subunit ribosomal protein S27Ae